MHPVSSSLQQLHSFTYTSGLLWSATTDIWKHVLHSGPTYIVLRVYISMCDGGTHVFLLLLPIVTLMSKIMQFRKVALFEHFEAPYSPEILSTVSSFTVTKNILVNPNLD